VSHGRSLRWRKSRGGPIAWVPYTLFHALCPLICVLTKYYAAVASSKAKNVTIEYRDYGLHPDLISQYAAELVKAQCDIIFAGGGAAIRAVQQATKTIPIIGISDDIGRDLWTRWSGQVGTQRASASLRPSLMASDRIS
jgi:hypothetical protein